MNFTTIYNVTCTKGPILQFDPIEFHAYVKVILKEKLGETFEQRLDQFQKMFSKLSKYKHLIVKDWSIGDVEIIPAIQNVIICLHCGAVKGCKCWPSSKKAKSTLRKN